MNKAVTTTTNLPAGSKRQWAKLALSLLMLASSASAAINNTACAYKMFPIFAGGAKQEDVYTLEVDPVTSNIFVGGRTQSSNFAPAENPHGYVYAISPEGNWLWGQFFYNVSYAVSSIDGIRLSQNGTYLNILGQANNKPIIMNLNKAKGQIQKFYTLDPMEPQSKTSYKTFQALYHEERNADDGLPYYYVSFQQSIDTTRQIHILKFSATDLKL
jgi:hypothetical protein